MATKLSARTLYDSARKSAKKVSLPVLIGVSIGGVIVTAISAAMDAPKCEQILDDYQEKIAKVKEEAKEENWSKKELTKELWITRGHCVLDLAKALWRTILSGSITIFSIVKSHKMQFRKQAILASLLNQAELARRDIITAARERLNKKDLEAIEEKIGEYESDRGIKPVMIIGQGDVPYYEPFSNQIIKSNEHKIQGAVNLLNDYMNRGSTASFNDFLDFLEVPQWRGGDEIGWDRNHDGLTEWYSRPAEYYDKDTGLKVPCLEICFYTPPHSDYAIFR